MTYTCFHLTVLSIPFFKFEYVLYQNRNDVMERGLIATLPILIGIFEYLLLIKLLCPIFSF